MSEENKEFKVVDRRSSAAGAEARENEKPKAQSGQSAEGEGFVMKEAEQKSEPSPMQLDFSTLVFSLATGALIHMGLAPDPASRKVQKNLELAKQNIEILSILKDKTKGNLTAEEDKLLENLLAETRLRFVEASR